MTVPKAHNRRLSIKSHISNQAMPSDNAAVQERISVTFTPRNSWVKNQLERDVELNPFMTKTGIVITALMEHYARRKHVNKIPIRQ